MQNFPLFPWSFYFSFITLKNFLNFLVVAFVKVIEINLKMLTVVNFEKSQQDLWWQQV